MATETRAIRANLDKDSLKHRALIKEEIADREGLAIGRVSDNRIVAEALEVYWNALKQKAS